jgi:hypothetical protein
MQGKVRNKKELKINKQRLIKQREMTAKVKLKVRDRDVMNYILENRNRMERKREKQNKRETLWEAKER